MSSDAANANKELGDLRKQAVVKAYVSLAAAMADTSVAIKAFAAHFSKLEDSDEAMELIQHSTMPVFIDPTGGAAPEEEKKKRKVAPKDPHAPKRPASAYLEYQNSVRADMRAAHPDIPYQEVVKLITADWAVLDPVEKAKFTDITAAKTAQFEIERDAYEAQLATDAIARGEAPPTIPKKRRKTEAAAEKTNTAMLGELATMITTKDKAKKAPAAKKVKAAAAAATVAAESSDSSDEDEDDDEEEEEEVAAPVKKPSNGKSKAKEVEVKKSKKVKA